MKKIFFIALLVLSVNLIFAYSYPPSFRELLFKFSEESILVEIETNKPSERQENVYDGKILLVADDYILFEETKYGEKIIITINNIVTIASIEK